MTNVSELLRLLTKNEPCERFAQVAHQKWVTMFDSLRSLTKNKRMERIARFFSSSLIFLQKTSELFWRAGHICLSTRKRGTLKHKQCLPQISQNWVLIQNFAVITGDKCFLLKCYQTGVQLKSFYFLKIQCWIFLKIKNWFRFVCSKHFFTFCVSTMKVLYCSVQCTLYKINVLSSLFRAYKNDDYFPGIHIVYLCRIAKPTKIH